MKLRNTPKVKLGVVGVSRDCFPVELARRRLTALMAELRKIGVRAHRCSVIVESHEDALEAVGELCDKDVDACVVYLGNFGPEGPTAVLMETFPGPVMACAAAEESKQVLAADRGDALCGMLNCSYNANLRRIPLHIPERPVGLPGPLALAIARFEHIARVVIGLSNLKLFGFGPRPQDFYACNAPIGPLHDLGVEVMENSELDLLQRYREAGEKKSRIAAVVREMKRELGPKTPYPDLLPRLAQLEVALLDFLDDNLAPAGFAAFANKCWPAFEAEFGFVPCYVNSRLAGKGYPVACEVDLYGALSEYLCQCASELPATLLDINNSVPDDVLPKKAKLQGAAREDLFMGFHCGNTTSSCMKSFAMSYQLIMNRLMEDGGEPDITRGTLEGQIRPGPITLFRLQSTPDCRLMSYLAEGEVLDIDPQTFGSTGIFAIPHFVRFYRHVLLEQGFPHHGAVAFDRVGGVLFDALDLAGVEMVGTPQPPALPYPTENPFT